MPLSFLHMAFSVFLCCQICFTYGATVLNYTSCLEGGVMEPTVPETNVCVLEALGSCQNRLISGNVIVTGSPSKRTWDLGSGGDGLLRLAPDTNVTASCFSILLESPLSDEVVLEPVITQTLLAPPFLRPANGAVSFLTLRDVEMRLNCGKLLEWQRHLCGVRLPGLTEVKGNRVSIITWRTKDVLLERVSLTCGHEGAAFIPSCSMASVNVVTDILEASYTLQEPSLPLVLTLSHGLDFSDPGWPEDGLRITANVTLSATLDSLVPVSFGLKTVLFTVDTSSSAAFLSFRGCILKDLPLSYLPLNHPRRPFGVLSTGLWPVQREEVAMGLHNCTLVLTHEEFQFWSYWLSILISPIPSVRESANWSYATGVKVEPSGNDYIQLASYYGRYTTLVDVRYQVSDTSDTLYTTQQRKNILQITGEAQVPPTVVFQVRDATDLLRAFQDTSNYAAAQYGQYIILTENLTLAKIPAWPEGGAVVRYPTTITTWPSSWVAFDLNMSAGLIVKRALSIKGMVLKSLVCVNSSGIGSGLGASSDDYYDRLGSGLWAFSVSNWRNADKQMLELLNVSVVVAPQEVNFYLSLVMANKTDQWMSSFQMDSYDTVNRTWVYFATIATLRFTGQQVNITSTIPEFPVAPSVSATDVSEIGGSWNAGGVKTDERREILLFAVLAITLPTALGAAIVTYIVMKRHRLRQMCSQSSGKQTHGKRVSGDGDNSESDDEENVRRETAAAQAPVCCFNLSLPLRRSKFVNPLYVDEPGRSPELVLTEVLGRTSRRPAPVDTVMSTIGDVLSAALEAEITACLTPTPGSVADGADAPGTRELQTTSDAGLAILDSFGTLRQPGGADWLEAAAWRSSAFEQHGLPSTSSPTLLSPRTQQPHAYAASASAGACGIGEPVDLHLVDVARAIRIGASDLPANSAGTNAVEGDSLGVAGDASLERHDSGCQASTSAPAAGPSLPNMQRLEQLQREIGDRHLEVLHSLGWGGCGVVYKGVWKGLQVAVKTMLLQGDTKQSRQFLTEAAISASLQHANVVTTYLYELRPLDEVDGGLETLDVRLQSSMTEGLSQDGMSCWKLYIVQEFCELGTLKAAIDQGYFKGARAGLPNMALLLTVAVDVAMGLVHVHAKDVVHGDVTVSNVLLQKCSSRPQGCIAKLADFGLSIKLEPEQSYYAQTYGGTPHYMAPERARGVLSKLSDIYSFGVCLWELYCGTPSWRRNSAGAHHRRYDDSNSSVDSGSHLPKYGEPRSVLAVGSDVFQFPRSCPVEYSSLVLSCLSPDPQSRPAAAVIVDALQRLQRRYE